MSMIEKAARAICEANSGPFELLSDEGKDACRREARAVLQALREPSEGMLIAGAGAIEDTDVWDSTDTKPYWGAEWTPCARAAWRKMIDHALGDG